MAMMRTMGFILGGFLTLTGVARAQDEAAFTQWRDAFAVEALAQGVSQAIVDRVIPTLKIDDEVIDLDRKQPEKKATFETYLRGALPESRIEKAQELLDANRPVLEAAAARYGVPAAVIVALWGMESSFGENMGYFSVLDSLATLAFEGRRGAFFKSQLIDALYILDQEGIDPAALEGSWAGAMGQCQFMPSTYRRFAVDGDGDGRRDIWENPHDVFASIANYLAAEGWRAGQSWGQEVMITRTIPENLLGIETPRSVSFWRGKGLRPMGRENWKALDDANAYLIQPDGAGGRRFLVYDNFLSVMKWNRSTYFATTVGLFSDRLK